MACHAMFTATMENYQATSDEKAKCNGFLKFWCKGSIQVKITALMFDVCDVFKKDLLVLPDVLTLRDSASRKSDVILLGPTPGEKSKK